MSGAPVKVGGLVERLHALEKIALIDKPLIRETIEALSAIPVDPDGNRFRFLIADPETGRHLLSLLQQKKGDEDSLRRMIDRIAASKAAAGGTAKAKS